MKYAISGDTEIKAVLKYGVVIVGAGIAGLYTALNLDESLSCCIIAKENVDVSNSWLAQGGIAAAIGGDDTPVFHLEDTMIAGAGLCDPDAASVLVDEGPSDISRLVELRVPFDLDEAGELQITREGGHRKDRVVHAGGDATGRETVKALAHIVSKRGNITFSGHTCMYDIIVCDGRAAGMVVRRDDWDFFLIETNNIVIATGGIGQLYKSTTNPSVATGDGLAAAIRAGAGMNNLEFIQFHPTGLWRPLPEDRAFLISEAVRGEGGLLVNSGGVRFMVGQHELSELAPRDIVARAIVRELSATGKDHAFIDITAKSEDFLKRRFPTIYSECLRRGINIAYDLIPVCPVQHYLMGGIATDINGRTNIRGLYACGEAASTGVHGANRLASNSMLECLVFGRRAAEDISNNSVSRPTAKFSYIGIGINLPKRPESRLEYWQLRYEIQQLMTEHCYVVRKKAGLETALRRIDEILAGLEEVYEGCNEYLETLNLATVAKAVLEAALSRTESIGSHYMEE